MGLSPQLDLGWSRGEGRVLRRGQKECGESMVSMREKKLTASESRIDERENEELDHSDGFFWDLALLGCLIGSCFFECFILDGCLNFGGG